MPAHTDRKPYDAEDANLIIDVRGILETLHRSGFTFAIACGGDGSIDVRLGDHTASAIANTQGDKLLTVAEAALWLRNAACDLYPDSRFARKYRNRAERRGCIHTPGTRWARSWGCTCPTDQPQQSDAGYLVDPKCPAHGFA